MNQINEKKQEIGAFIEWLSETKDIRLCTYVGTTETNIPERAQDLWQPVPEHVNHLIAEYYGIDLEKLEQERQVMIEAFQLKK
ncbi:hypothetical protein D3C80_1884350 [compost metagenome]